MLSDLQISQKAILKPITEIAQSINIPTKYLRNYGEFKAKVKLKLLNEQPSKKKGKLVYVTAMSPTKYGEGKTVTTIGLTQGLQALNAKAIACIRQPSLGPIFGTKGGAAGGGYSQVVPMDELNLHCTGDIHAITSAHNLAAAAIDARIYHEQRLGYADYEKRTGYKALKIDPQNVVWQRSVDHNDRALRMIDVGINQPGKNINGFKRADGFSITAASELMAIIALSTSFVDMRKRIGRIVLGYNLEGNPVTADDLQVAGSMTVILKDVIEPTLMQTNEGVPALVHSGPFANIAHGNSSIIADEIGLTCADYVITEGGFGSDMGFEKGCNIKARQSGNLPSCAVVVATCRAIKSHSGLSEDETINDNSTAIEKGFSNLKWHIENVLKYGVPVVVAINQFPQDTKAELNQVRELITDTFKGKHVDVALSQAFVKGGEGAVNLAEKVITACNQPAKFNYLYDMNLSLLEKIETIAIKGYGANKVQFSEKAAQQLEEFESMNLKQMQVCIAKTPVSISDNPKLLGSPENFSIHINEIKCCFGAGFIYALCTNVMTMPGLSEKPAFMNVDIDEKGKIVGLY